MHKYSILFLSLFKSHAFEIKLGLLSTVITFLNKKLKSIQKDINLNTIKDIQQAEELTVRYTFYNV